MDTGGPRRWAARQQEKSHDTYHYSRQARHGCCVYSDGAFRSPPSVSIGRHGLAIAQTIKSILEVPGPLPKEAVWSIEGVVVDERGNPVGGAVVHAREEADQSGAKTAIDGKFTLWAGHGPMYTRELVVESDGGAMGRVQFVPCTQCYTKAPVRVVLKLAKTVTCM